MDLIEGRSNIVKSEEPQTKISYQWKHNIHKSHGPAFQQNDASSSSAGTSAILRVSPTDDGDVCALIEDDSGRAFDKACGNWGDVQPDTFRAWEASGGKGGSFRPLDSPVTCVARCQVDSSNSSELAVFRRGFRFSLTLCCKPLKLLLKIFPVAAMPERSMFSASSTPFRLFLLLFRGGTPGASFGTVTSGREGVDGQSGLPPTDKRDSFGEVPIKEPAAHVDTSETSL